MKTTCINKKANYTGNLKCKGNVSVFGEIKGNINTKKIVSVEKTGIVVGNITSEIVYINGKVNGNINAKKAVILKDDGNVFGEIKTPSIIVEERSSHNGQLNLV